MPLVGVLLDILFSFLASRMSHGIGAPIEVMERMKAIEGLEPKAARKVAANLDKKE